MRSHTSIITIQIHARQPSHFLSSPCTSINTPLYQHPPPHPPTSFPIPSFPILIHLCQHAPLITLPLLFLPSPSTYQHPPLSSPHTSLNIPLSPPPTTAHTSTPIPAVILHRSQPPTTSKRRIALSSYLPRAIRCESPSTSWGGNASMILASRWSESFEILGMGVYLDLSMLGGYGMLVEGLLCPCRRDRYGYVNRTWKAGMDRYMEQWRCWPSWTSPLEPISGGREDQIVLVCTS